MQETLLKLISLGSIGLLGLSAILIMLRLFKIKSPVENFIEANRLSLLFLFSLAGTVGSLLLSIYFKLAPCELCWYQRLFLFPIPIIMYIAVIKNDASAKAYAFWLSIIGLVIATYHSLLQAGIFAPGAVFCDPNSGVDCSVAAFTYFGFVTIPVMSFALFLLIALIAYAPKKI